MMGEKSDSRPNKVASVAIHMPRSKRNRTIVLTEAEREKYREELAKVDSSVSLGQIWNKEINQDVFEVLDLLPSGFVDLLFVDPPYNLTKTFNGRSFKQKSIDQYAEWMDSWLRKITRLLKPTASVYLCGDW